MLLSQSEVIHSALTGTQICCICTTHIFLCLFGWQSSVHPTETVERQEKWCGKRKEISSVSSTTHLFSFFFSTSKTHSWASVFWSLCNSVHFCGNGFQISLLLLYSYTYENVCFSVCLMVFLCVASPSATRRSDGHFESMKGSVCQNSYVCLSVSVACDSSRFLYPHNTKPNIFLSPSIACQVSLFPVLTSQKQKHKIHERAFLDDKVTYSITAI